MCKSQVWEETLLCHILHFGAGKSKACNTKMQLVIYQILKFSFTLRPIPGTSHASSLLRMLRAWSWVKVYGMFFADCAVSTSSTTSVWIKETSLGWGRKFTIFVILSCCCCFKLDRNILLFFGVVIFCFCNQLLFFSNLCINWRFFSFLLFLL